MFDVGGGELILIVLAIIVLFGPKKIPEIAQMFGKGMQHFRKAQQELKDQISVVQSEVNREINNVNSEFKSVEKSADLNSDIKSAEPIPPLRTYKPITTELDNSRIVE